MAKNFGKEEDAAKLNMNKAKAEDMVTTLGLTPEEAKALVVIPRQAWRVQRMGRHAGHLRR